ncbi:MAG TPA: hypothetical protein VE010_00170 [Thermoanaerobaculia bacterium]|nr:hypothetical protein [Thermoanaerobaculia bacterium]
MSPHHELPPPRILFAATHVHVSNDRMKNVRNRHRRLPKYDEVRVIPAIAPAAATT